MQDQTVSACTPSSRTTGRVKLPFCGCWPLISTPSTPPIPTSRMAELACSRNSSTTSRGESGRPVASAGHASWHFPHFVQASNWSRCTPLKSASAAISGGLGGQLRRDRSQPLAGLRVAHHQRAEAGQHVRRLGVGDCRHERERQQPVRPPDRVPDHPQHAVTRADPLEALSHQPAGRRELVVAGLIHGDACALEHVAGHHQHEQNAHEGPVPYAIHAPLRGLLRAVGTGVVELLGALDPAPGHHHHHAGQQRQAEHVQHDRVAEIEVAVEEAPAEHRLGEVGVDREDDGADEEHHEAVEDAAVRPAGVGVAPPDRDVGQQDSKRFTEPSRQLGEWRPAAPRERRYFAIGRATP